MKIKTTLPQGWNFYQVRLFDNFNLLIVLQSNYVNEICKSKVWSVADTKVKFYKLPYLQFAYIYANTKYSDMVLQKSHYTWTT